MPVVNGMSTGDHALAQDSGNQNAVAVLTVKQAMRTLFVTAQTGTDIVKGTT